MDDRILMTWTIERTVLVVLVLLAGLVAAGCRTSGGKEALSRMAVRTAGDVAARAWLASTSADNVEALRTRILDDAKKLTELLEAEDAGELCRLEISEQLLGTLSAYAPLARSLLETALSEVSPVEALGAANVKRAKTFLAGVTSGATNYRR